MEEFNKYQIRGAYHWDEYTQDTVYKKHADYVKSWAKGKNILDVGAGDGLITSLLKAEGIDSNELAVKLAKERGAKVKLGSAYKLSGKYDAVYLGDTLEHLEFPEECLKQIKKVLKGTLYITIPPKGNKCKYDYHEWNAEELTELVEEQGFKKDGRFKIANSRLYAKFKFPL
jgi:2-polyprenyl-3-methyl-5-hydroxy-6-metoxy-1,4-benzoquinol methylase